MENRGIARAATWAALLFAPLGLGGCAYPTYRYYSAPCGSPPAGLAVIGTPQVVQGSGGKQCLYAAPDYAAMQAAYPYGYYDPGWAYDDWDYGLVDPFWAGGLGWGGLYGGGFYGYYGHGFYGHGVHGGGWGGFHGGGGGFHGGGGGFHGGGGGGGGHAR